MSLNDFDLPVHALAKRQTIIEAITSVGFLPLILFIQLTLILLPENVQESVFETVVVGGINFTIVGFTVVSSVNFPVVMAVLVLILVAIIWREVALERSRRRRRSRAVMPVDVDEDFDLVDSVPDAVMIEKNAVSSLNDEDCYYVGQEKAGDGKGLSVKPSMDREEIKPRQDAEKPLNRYSYREAWWMTLRVSKGGHVHARDSRTSDAHMLVPPTDRTESAADTDDACDEPPVDDRTHVHYGAISMIEEAEHPSFRFFKTSRGGPAVTSASTHMNSKEAAARTMLAHADDHANSAHASVASAVSHQGEASDVGDASIDTPHNDPSDPDRTGAVEGRKTWSSASPVSSPERNLYTHSEVHSEPLTLTPFQAPDRPLSHPLRLAIPPSSPQAGGVGLQGGSGASHTGRHRMTPAKVCVEPDLDTRAEAKDEAFRQASRTSSPRQMALGAKQLGGKAGPDRRSPRGPGHGATAHARTSLSSTQPPSCGSHTQAGDGQSPRDEEA
jgi:hypothetical protein